MVRLRFDQPRYRLLCSLFWINKVTEAVEMDIIVTALAVSAVSIIVAFREGLVSLIQRWFNRISREESTFVQGMETLRELHEIMERILRVPKVGRVLMFAGSNSGGIPRPESPFYSQAIHGYQKRSLSDIDAFERFRHKREMDGEYVKMLLKIYDQGKIVIDVATMPECKLKMYYTTEKIHHSVIFFLAIREMKFLYISVATHREEPFTPEELTLFELGIEDIRSVIRGVH